MLINFVAEHQEAKATIVPAEDKQKSLLQMLTTYALKSQLSLPLFKNCFVCLKSLANSKDVRSAFFKLNFYSECASAIQKHLTTSKKKDNERISSILQFLAQVSLHEDGQLHVFKLTGKPLFLMRFSY